MKLISYEYPTCTVDPIIMNTLNSSYTQQSKFHCQKCGRPSRTSHRHANHRRVKSEQHQCRHGHLLKYNYQQRLFPTELPPYPIVTQTNDNHFQISKNNRSRKSSRESNKQNVLIDQFIQVQQLDTTRCSTRDYKKDKHRSTPNTLQRVQQIIYLRENINNLTYREHHFPNEYIILKRLEEKNNLINRNRCKVDPYFRSLKLQYQTLSVLLQNTTITSFTYSEQEPCQPESIIKTPRNQNTSSGTRIASDRSLPAIVEMNDSITDKSLVKQNDYLSIADPTDSLIFITPYKQQQQYSQNATQSYLDPDYVLQTKKQNSLFDTTVIVDVTKHPQESSAIYASNQPIYFDHVNIHRPQTIFLPRPENYNYQPPISTDTILYNPIYNESLGNISHETTCFFSDFKQSNEMPFLPRTNSSRQTSESTTSDTTSTPNTTSETNNQSTKYTQVINKIKEILNTLQKHLLTETVNKTITPLNINQTSNKIDKSISTIMTTDSLISNTSIQTTYSVSSTLPLLNKNSSSLPYSKSTETDILQIEFDSLNSTKSTIKLINLAKNINTNQQISEDDETHKSFNYPRLRTTRSVTHRMTVQYMSSSFMFVLQILLMLCLINRILMYDFCGIVPTDTSIVVDNSQSVTPILSTFVRKTEQIVISTNEDIISHFLASLYKLF